MPTTTKSNKEIKATLLKFGTGNAKLEGQGIATFSIPAGFTCPGACECLSRFDRDTHKIRDGKDTKFRCFSASSEAAFNTVRNAVDFNWEMLKKAKSAEKMTELILDSLPQRGYKTIRVHVGGDFYSPAYFLAWMEVARRSPDRLFYAYTKSLKYWVDMKLLVPKNFVLTASYGGKFDDLIAKHKLRHSVVVFHPDEAEKLGLQIDHDDSHARNPKCKAFALLIHNTQPAGSPAAAAIKRMKDEGVKFSYGRPDQKTHVGSTPTTSEKVWDMLHPKK